MTTAAHSRSPTLAEVLRAGIEARLANVHVALPGKIERYDPATQKADVKPLLMRRVATADGGELVEALPVITDVPLAFPRAAQFFISFPLQVGDHVLLVFTDQSLDNFMLGQGADTDPDDFRTHDLSDAVAFPGFWPFARALAQADALNMVLGKDQGGIQIHLTPAGTMEVKVNGIAAHHVAIGEILQAFMDGPLKTWHTTHTHPTGTGPSGTPVQSASYPAFDATIISQVLALKGP